MQALKEVDARRAAARQLEARREAELRELEGDRRELEATRAQPGEARVSPEPELVHVQPSGAGGLATAAEDDELRARQCGGMMRCTVWLAG